MEILGYSERGVINSLLYEAYYSEDPIARMRVLLKRCCFPLHNSGPLPFVDGTIIIEQKFPTFGDADAMLLLDGDPQQCIFVEGKVKTLGRPVWRIDDVWEKFLKCLEDGRPESNLFEQLYRKQKLVRLLRNPGVDLQPDAVSQYWTIGNHQIVADVAARLANYVANPWYLAIVPETRQRLEQFWRTVKTDVTRVLPEWDLSRWGFLTWEDIDEMCRSGTSWPNTLRCLDYNRGQIFAGIEQPVTRFWPGEQVNWTKGGITTSARFKRRGRHNSRLVFPDGTEKVVPNPEIGKEPER